MRFRNLRVLACLSLVAAGVQAPAVGEEVSPSDARLKASVLGSSGGGPHRCLGTISQLLEAHVDLVEARVLGLGEVSLPAGEEADADVMARWLDRRRSRASVRALVFILSDARPTTVRIDAFWVPSGTRAALRTLKVSKGCRIAPRLELAFQQWIEGIVRPRPDPRRPAPLVTSAVAPVEAEVPPVATATQAIDAPPLTPGGSTDAPTVVPPVVEPERGATEGEAETPVTLWPDFVLRLGVALSSRTFRYQDPASPNLREYRFDLIPVPELSLEVGLGALLGLSPGANRFSFEGSYAEAFGLESQRSEGGPVVPTTYRRLSLAARYAFRVILDERELDLFPRAGFHHSRFALGPARDGSREDALPGVSYSSVQLGLLGCYAFRPTIQLFAGGSYLLVLTRGELAGAAYFPQGSAHGVAAEGGASVEIFPGFALSLGAEYVRYFLSFQPSTEATRIAGGATDEAIALFLGLGLRR